MGDTKPDIMRHRSVRCYRPKPKETTFKKLRTAIKACAMRLRRKDDELDIGFGQIVSTVAAWIGALVVTGVVVRSLYLMYIKPDTT